MSGRHCCLEDTAVEYRRSIADIVLGVGFPGLAAAVGGSKAGRGLVGFVRMVNCASASKPLEGKRWGFASGELNSKSMSTGWTVLDRLNGDLAGRSWKGLSRPYLSVYY